MFERDCNDEGAVGRTRKTATITSTEHDKLNDTENPSTMDFAEGSGAGEKTARLRSARVDEMPLRQASWISSRVGSHRAQGSLSM